MPANGAMVSQNSVKKRDGFTNIAATGDDNKTVFTVEEKKVFRDPNVDWDDSEYTKGKSDDTPQNDPLRIGLVG